jgi:hypothetical protein
LFDHRCRFVGQQQRRAFSYTARIFSCVITTSAIPCSSSGAGGITIGLVRVGIEHSKKSRQKRAKRVRHARGEKRATPNKHEQRAGEQLWLQELWHPTLFDVIRALQERQPMRLEVLPKLDGWGVAFFIMLILQFFGGAYASTRDKPYQLPRATPGREPGADSQDQGNALGFQYDYPVDDLYEFFSAIRKGQENTFDSGDAMRSEDGEVTDLGRFKRSSGHHHGYPTGHHEHHRSDQLEAEHDRDHEGHHKSRRRPPVGQAPSPLQDAVTYPEDKLSAWIKKVFNSVESVVSLCGPALRAVGFEPDELIEVHRSVSGMEHIPTPPKNVTAAEFSVHLTTDGNEKFRLKPLTDRGHELQKIITDKGRYGKDNFLAKEVLNPIKRKHFEDGTRAIGDKFIDIDRIFLDDSATIYHVKGQMPLKIHMSSSYVTDIRGELGTIVKIPSRDGNLTRYFAIVPHHPDMVIQVPDPSSKKRWNTWMGTTGKHLFFNDPSIFPGASTFSAEEQDLTDLERAAGLLRGAVHHTVKPIVDETMQHMTELVSHETLAEKALNRILGFIPFYDFSKSVIEGKYEKAMVFLSFDLIPYVGKGAKILIKTTFRSAPAHLAVDQVAKWADRGFEVLSKSGSGPIADAVADHGKGRASRAR